MKRTHSNELAVVVEERLQVGHGELVDRQPLTSRVVPDFYEDFYESKQNDCFAIKVRVCSLQH